MTLCFESLTEHIVSTILCCQIRHVLFDSFSVVKSAGYNFTEYVYFSHCSCLYWW